VSAEQLRFPELRSACGCWRVKEEGLTVRAYSCPECVRRALDYLEGLLHIDREVSVSGLGEGAKEVIQNQLTFSF